MRAVRFEVSSDLLRDVLHMPETCKIVFASVVDVYNGNIKLVVVDDAFPEGDEPYDVDPTCTQVAAVPEQIIWNWNLPARAAQ